MHCYITLLRICTQTPGIWLKFLSLLKEAHMVITILHRYDFSECLSSLSTWFICFPFCIFIDPPFSRSQTGIDQLELTASASSEGYWKRDADMLSHFRPCLSASLRWMGLAFSPHLVLRDLLTTLITAGCLCFPGRIIGTLEHKMSASYNQLSDIL